jgi:hypothetical protein
MWQDPAVGALPALYASAAPAAQPGAYYGPSEGAGMRGLPGWAAIPEKAEDEDVSARLWTKLEELSGVPFGSAR